MKESSIKNAEKVLDKWKKSFQKINFYKSGSNNNLDLEKETGMVLIKQEEFTYKSGNTINSDCRILFEYYKNMSQQRGRGSSLCSIIATPEAVNLLNTMGLEKYHPIDITDMDIIPIQEIEKFTGLYSRSNSQRTMIENKGEDIPAVKLFILDDKKIMEFIERQH